MKTTQLHLAYIGLILLLTLTILISFPYSMYLFATMKAALIVIFFMKISKSENASKLYMFIAVALMGIILLGTLDDVLLRPFVFAR